MRLSTRLFQEFSHRITLFTRPNCSLCDEAKEALARVSSKRTFNFAEVDVMQPAQKKWKDLYEFDTPVVSIYSYGSSLEEKNREDLNDSVTADIMMGILM